MGIFALILGVLGGLSAVMGILTALEAVPVINAEFTWLYWFGLSVILFLATIASLLTQARPEYPE